MTRTAEDFLHIVTKFPNSVTGHHEAHDDPALFNLAIGRRDFDPSDEADDPIENKDTNPRNENALDDRRLCQRRQVLSVDHTLHVLVINPSQRPVSL